MDQERFDHLVRGLAAGITRRGIVRDLAGAALGGILVSVGVREAGAKKKRGKGKKQQASRKRQGRAGASAIKGKCPRPNRCGKGKQAQCCTGGQICQNGGCVTACAPDCTNKCGGVSDGCSGTCDATCPCAPDCAGKCGGASDGCSGTCDAACPCAPDCTGGQECCSGVCSALDTRDHCGTCGNACSYPTSCQTSVDGVSFCSNGGYCRPCTGDAGCAVPNDPTVYRCVDHGIDICGQGYTTTCMVVPS